MNNIEARLQNTERALLGLVALAMHLIPAEDQDCIEGMLEEYFDANLSLGFDAGSVAFLTQEDVEPES